MFKKKSLLLITAVMAFSFCLQGCGPCFKARKLREKAAGKSGAERRRLEGQAASMEQACLKKRDEKYESEMQKKFEEMEEKARY